MGKLHVCVKYRKNLIKKILDKDISLNFFTVN